MNVMVVDNLPIFESYPDRPEVYIIRKSLWNNTYYCPHYRLPKEYSKSRPAYFRHLAGWTGGRSFVHERSAIKNAKKWIANTEKTASKRNKITILVLI